MKPRDESSPLWIFPLRELTRRAPGRTLCGLFLSLILVCGSATTIRSVTLLGLTDTGEVFSSTDNGVTWTGIATIAVSDATAIAAGLSTVDLYMASRAGIVYHSSDGGANWTAVGTVPASDIVDMAIRTNGDIYLLSATGTLWRSLDGGATFSAIATLTAANFISLTGDTGGGNMYALTKTGEVAKSTDFGTTWNTVGTITTSEAVGIRAVGQTLYVLTSSGDVAESADNGATWLMVGTASQVHMVGLTRNGNGLVVVTSEGLVATSNDATAWSFVGSINQVNVVAIGNDSPTITGISSRPPLAPSLALSAPWPNPLTVGNTVNFAVEVSTPGQVALELCDVAGRRVAQLGQVLAAETSAHVVWNLPRLASGVYFVRASSTSGLRAERKLVIAR